MPEKKKTIQELTTEARAKLIEGAEKKKADYLKVRENALSVKSELDQEQDEKKKANLLATFEKGKLDAVKAKDDYEKSRIKASQHVKVEGSKVESVKTADYVPEPKERGHMHVELDMPSYDKRTGDKRSKAFIQKFTVRAYSDFIKQRSLGYTVNVVWDGLVYMSI